MTAVVDQWAVWAAEGLEYRIAAEEAAAAWLDAHLGDCQPPNHPPAQEPTDA